MDAVSYLTLLWCGGGRMLPEALMATRTTSLNSYVDGLPHPRGLREGVITSRRPKPSDASFLAKRQQWCETAKEWSKFLPTLNKKKRKKIGRLKLS